MTAEKTASRAYHMLWKLKGLCYGQQSNEIFDELHDVIYWQCIGISQSIEECQEYGDWESSSKEFKQALQMAKQIKAYHKAVTSQPDIDWLYA